MDDRRSWVPGIRIVDTADGTDRLAHNVHSTAIVLDKTPVGLLRWCMTRLNDITNAVYSGAVKECERHKREEPRIHGNGQDMAQHIVNAVRDRLTAASNLNPYFVLQVVHNAALDELDRREMSPGIESHALLAARAAQAITDNVKAELVSRQLFQEPSMLSAHGELPVPEIPPAPAPNKDWWKGALAVISFIIILFGGIDLMTFDVSKPLAGAMMLTASVAVYIYLSVASRVR